MTSTNRRSELWQRLRIARNLAQLTQLQLSDRMHISRPAVAFWENKNPAARTQMDSDQLQRYSAIVNVPLGLLLDDSLTSGQFEDQARSARLLDPEQQRAQPRLTNSQATGLAFFSAVRFGVMAANPKLADAFDVELHAGALGLVASFVVPGHLVQFVIQQQGEVEGGDRLQIVKETGYLLMLERALAHGGGKAYRTLKKHMILYTPTSTYNMQGRADYEDAFDVDLHIGGDVAVTVQYLLNMV